MNAEWETRAKAFAALHVPGEPLVLFNAWDAGSAKTVAEAGAKAVATGSWAVAAAQGFPDGEKLPLELAELGVARISHAGAPWRLAMKALADAALKAHALED
jgi:2-methylisocitrate lyase-like PEP mutase family enzyme